MTDSQGEPNLNRAGDPKTNSGHRLPKWIVVGLGNPILGDDGIGWVIAEQVRAELSEHPQPAGASVDVICLALGGLSLMEHLADYDRAVLIDSIQTGRDPPGTVYTFPLEALPTHTYHHVTAAHDTSLQTALQVGRSMGIHLPDEIWVVAIEAHQVHDFTEKITPEVEAAIPEAIQQVLTYLGLR